MSKASLAQSSTAVTRLQFLVLMMMKNGATVTEALEEALRWGPAIPTATSTTDVRMPNGPRTSMKLQP
jgi:hypothetical protein